jgi:hypothetical protein
MDRTVTRLTLIQNEIEKRINPQRQNRSDPVAANGNGQSRAGCSKNQKSKNCSTPTRNEPQSRWSKSETGEHSSRSTRNKSAPAHGQKNRSAGHKVLDLDRKQWTWFLASLENGAHGSRNSTVEMRIENKRPDFDLVGWARKRNNNTYLSSTMTNRERPNEENRLAHWHKKFLRSRCNKEDQTRQHNTKRCNTSFSI